ncbi:FAD-dependent oxidoreductase [Thermodesulfobacteriota bacterium]
MEHLHKLFEPIKIGDVEIKNRIVMSPMGLGWCEEDGTVTDRLVEFYSQRARGGAGLIIIVTGYNDFGNKMPMSPALEDEKFLPGLTRLTDAVHEHGAKVFAQLMHQGASSFSFVLGAQPVSASAVRSGLTREMPRELTRDEIKLTIEHLAEGAAMVKKAGFDGVEVIGTGGYLINQFISPLTNERTDEYGGDFEGRIRFPTELVQTIRDRVGAAFPISYRTCGDSFMPGGNRQEDIQQVVQAMERAGVDVINQAVGWHQAPMPLITMNVPRGAFVYLAQGIKDVVDVPVIACHRINDPVLAEQVLFDHRADLIGFGRPFLVDPEFPNKAAEQRFGEIRYCTACNTCFDMIFSAQPVTCAFNPAVGKEKEFEITPAEKPKKVVVVGGGIGGMEAARVLTLRGHDVRLYEKSDKLGGALNLAAIPPGREELATAVNYLANEMKRLNVTVEMQTEADIDSIAGMKPDAVVLATGATPIWPKVPGIDRKNVVHAHDVLEGKAEVKGKVVVIGGGATGAETALFIAKRKTINPDVAVFLASKKGVDPEAALQMTRKGGEVTVLEMINKIGQDIGRATRWTIIGELREYGVNMVTLATATEITDKGVVYEHEGQEKVAPADTVVIAAGVQPRKGLAESLEGVVAEVHNLGDCVDPRHAMDAIHEAARIARQI